MLISELERVRQEWNLACDAPIGNQELTFKSLSFFSCHFHYLDPARVTCPCFPGEVLGQDLSGHSALLFLSG